MTENIPFWRPQNHIVARRVRLAGRGVDHFIAISERARLHLTTAGVPDESITVAASLLAQAGEAVERPTLHVGTVCGWCPRDLRARAVA